ncbi:MAG: TRAP transporter permease [Deltaproteobacteria bacterium]|nr:TRAP transporter permease [Deltaproteobacteria bacterium]
MKSGIKGLAVAVIAICMSLFHLYTAGFRQFPAMQQRVAHLAFAMMLVFLLYPSVKEDKPASKFFSWVDILLVVASLLLGLYVFVDYEGISGREISRSFWDTTSSLVAIVLVTEATRRIMGLTMGIIVLVALGYVAFGAYLPPIFAHSGYTFERVVNHMFLTTDGILGVALSVSATVIIVFLIFGAFLEQSGGSLAFTNIGYGLFGMFKGGAAKAAVLGSCLFGMFTGSQTANVAAVGTLTIPLMIRAGYKNIMAAAIEALASTGGMLVPPVMGAAAFIIPEILGVSYIDVMKAALIPGLLFYSTVFTFIQVQANKLGIQKVSRKDLPRIWPIIKENGHLFVPIFVILYLLIWEDATPKKAGFWAVIALVVVSMVRKNTRMTFSKILTAMQNGAKTSLVVAMACASAGLIEGVINLTGLGLRFSEILIYVAGGNIIYLLILTMIASLIIGLPLPPVTAYLILAILAAPALIKSGVDPMGAHLFIFYFGVLGNITPPSAPCSFAAAGIAKTDPMKTTNLAFLISAPTFIVPFLLVYSPELMMKGSIIYTAFRILTAFVAISGLSMAFLGFANRQLNLIERLFLLMACVCLISQIWWANVLGYAAISAIYLRQRYRAKQNKLREASQSLKNEKGIE